jgi:hypothetical protein
MNVRITPIVRRFVLCGALAAALAAWAAIAPPPVRVAAAAEPSPAAPSASNKAKPAMPAPPAAPADVAKPKAGEAASEKETDEPDVAITPRGIIIDHGGGRVRIGSGVDREYDSFEQFAKDAPWLAGLVFFVVALVFLVPLLIIVLLIWYKVRKNRMLNETMIKLAEKGVVPPAEAMEALSANRVDAAVTSSPATAPMYEQAKTLRRRAAWSDLRKGVLLIAVGFGLTIWSMLEDGTPSGLGLILLFVGIAFCVLWFFEERDPARSGLPPGRIPPGGA